MPYSRHQHLVAFGHKKQLEVWDCLKLENVLNAELEEGAVALKLYSQHLIALTSDKRLVCYKLGFPKPLYELKLQQQLSTTPP